MKRRTSERVTSISVGPTGQILRYTASRPYFRWPVPPRRFERLLTCGIQRDAGFSVEFTRFHRNRDAACGQRQTSRVEYRSAGDPARDIQHALIVLIPAAAVGL